MVLLIATIIEHHLSNSPQPLAFLDIFKVIILEEAYSKSPYNFDIQLQLMRSFERLGINASYYESYAELGIKGVQLETLGFLWTRHAMNWLSFPSTSAVMAKYAKYLKHNADDLGGNKRKAVEDVNYEAVNNFIDYEAYLSKSYFTRFIFGYYRRAKALINQLGTEQVKLAIPEHPRSEFELDFAMKSSHRVEDVLKVEILRHKGDGPSNYEYFAEFSKAQRYCESIEY